MNALAIAQLLVLLLVANGMPVLAKRLLGERMAFPLDGGRRFLDGRPLLGRSKTLRGVVLSVLLCAAAAPLVALPWRIGVAVGIFAMIGDLFSSFVKRRLDLAPSSRAIGLDQIPESLFPLLACRTALSLAPQDIAAVVAIFLVGELLLSRALYRVHLRDRPY